MIARILLKRPNLPALISLFLLVGSQISACGGLSPSVQKTQVTVQFNNYHGSEYAGFYVADQGQYYADEDLQVSFIPGDLASNPVEAIASGAAQFGVTSADNLLRAKSQGTDVIGVATIFRLNPISLIAAKESGIRKPDDLVGKKVGTVSANLDTPRDQQFMILLKYMNIDPSSVEFIPIMDVNGISDLTNGKVNAISGYSGTQQMVRTKFANVSLEQIYYCDYGIPFYPNVLFTTRRLIVDNPDLVQRLVHATLSGYYYALEYPQEAAELSLNYDSGLDVQGEVAALQAQIPLIDTGDAPVGWMDPPIWQATQDILLQQGIIAAPLDLEEVFTNQYVENSQ